MKTLEGLPSFFSLFRCEPGFGLTKSPSFGDRLVLTNLKLGGDGTLDNGYFIIGCTVDEIAIVTDAHILMWTKFSLVRGEETKAIGALRKNTHGYFTP